MLFTNDFNIFEIVIKAGVMLSFLMTFSLLVALIVVRSRNAIYKRRQVILTAQWRGIFNTAFTGASFPELLPPIHKDDWFTVLSIYVQVHDVRDDDRARSAEVFARLDDLAQRLGIGDYSISLLERGDDADKILALNILGQIRDARALEPAIALTQEKGAELSRAAAHCALRIAPNFIGDFLAILLERSDWVRSRVETMLREVAPTVLGSAMRDTMATAPEEAKPHLLDYVRFCPPMIAHEVCTDTLRASSDPEVLAAALRSLAPLATERDHATAVTYVNYGEAIVSLSALRVLRKCVNIDDRDLLVRMTGHSDYWVRLRAAEVAVQLFGVGAVVEQFASKLADPYARRAVEQVLAERAMTAKRAA